MSNATSAPRHHGHRQCMLIMAVSTSHTPVSSCQSGIVVVEYSQLITGQVTKFSKTIKNSVIFSAYLEKALNSSHSQKTVKKNAPKNNITSVFYD